MEHLAIDLGGKEPQICVRSSDGTILEERRTATASLKKYMAGRPGGGDLHRSVRGSRRGVGVGPRGAGRAGVPGEVVGSGGTRSQERPRRRSQSERGVVPDGSPSVHNPSKEARERKTTWGMREALVESRTKLVNTVRGWLRAGATRVPTGGVESIARRQPRAQGSRALELMGTSPERRFLEERLAAL
jgi:hypothetical protein